MAKKYLIITLSFRPESGGVAEYIYNFSKYLDGEVTVLSCKIKNNRDCYVEDYPHLKNLCVKIVPYFHFAPWLSKCVMLTFAAILQKKEGFSLVICNHAYVGYAAVFLKKIFKVEYLLITHGWEVARNSIFDGKYTHIIRQARAIVSVSNFTREQVLLQYQKAADVRVIPPVLNEELINGKEIDPGFKKRLGLENKKIMLTVGRLDLNTGRKGHDLVLMALPAILKKYPDAVYLIFGEGQGEKTLKVFAERLKISNNVVFCGYDRDNIHNYYNICDVFIMPSRHTRKEGLVEGFGIVYLEAAFFAKPAIGGRSGGIADAVSDGKTGLLVNPFSPDDIAKAVIRLFDDPSYANRLGEQARIRVLSEFSGATVGGKIRQLISQITA